MSAGPELMLVGAVAVVGVLHTIVPDHWLPIALIARQRGWSRGETALASLQAGIGHIVSTLLIAVVVWLAGVAVAARFGHLVDTAASLALVGFGGWIAVSAWRELRDRDDHHHDHHHGHGHAHGLMRPDSGEVHGQERQRIATSDCEWELSIYESGVPPRFRLTGAVADAVSVETLRTDGTRHLCPFADHGTYWESTEEIPEPHAFEITVTVQRDGHAHTYETRFAEHDHEHGGVHDDGQNRDRELAEDPLYAPMRGDSAVLVRHVHVHRHGRGAAHAHWHDHRAETAHPLTAILEAEPPLHQHRHKSSGRTTLLLIMGSSPMIEGIPAFFAAGKYGIGLIIAMALVFAFSTIATYVVLCVYSTAGLQRLRFGGFERYGEVLSGAFIALVGVAFWAWPVL